MLWRRCENPWSSFPASRVSPLASLVSRQGKSVGSTCQWTPALWPWRAGVQQRPHDHVGSCGCGVSRLPGTASHFQQEQAPYPVPSLAFVSGTWRHSRCSHLGYLHLSPLFFFSFLLRILGTFLKAYNTTPVFDAGYSILSPSSMQVTEAGWGTVASEKPGHRVRWSGCHHRYPRMDAHIY